MSYYVGKNVLITGGTGSIGSKVVCKLLEAGVGKAVVLSRTESGHERLDRTIAQHFGSIKCIASDVVEHRIGDVRNYQTVYEAAMDCSIVFHVAAMKYVPFCEDNPFESVQTNVIGAQNVRNACINCGVDKVIVVSTDKAANPRGIMGMTKYIQEQLFLKPKMPTTVAVITRFGNVLGSEGSVVWKFKEQYERGARIMITNPEMKRFVMTPDDAANLIMWAGIQGLNNEIVVKRMKMCTIIDLAKAIAPLAAFEIIGVRRGEKVEETLFNTDELESAVFVESVLDGGVIVVSLGQFSTDEKLRQELISNNEPMMTIDEIREMLVKAEVL